MGNTTKVSVGAFGGALATLVWALIGMFPQIPDPPSGVEAATATVLIGLIQYLTRS